MSVASGSAPPKYQRHSVEGRPHPREAQCVLEPRKVFRRTPPGTVVWERHPAQIEVSVARSQGPRASTSGVAIVWRRLGLLEELRPHHRDIQRRINADPNLVSIDAHHLDSDVVANKDGFANSAPPCEAL